LFAVQLNGQWMAWVDALAKTPPWPLGMEIRSCHHGNPSGPWPTHRLQLVAWPPASAKSSDPTTTFLDSIGRKATAVAAVVFALLHDQLDVAEGRRLLAIDDTPTERYGPEVQGAGIHHDPHSRPGRLEVRLRP